MKRNIDDITGSLLKKSIQTMPDNDFTEKVMERITGQVTEKKKILPGISISVVLLLVSLVLLPATIRVLANTFTVIHIGPENMFMIYSIFFSTCLLLILRNLVREIVEHWRMKFHGPFVEV